METSRDDTRSEMLALVFCVHSILNLIKKLFQQLHVKNTYNHKPALLRKYLQNITGNKYTNFKAAS
jgi:hypothetical protein